MGRNQTKLYLKNISRRWQSELKAANRKIIILSPYLTSRTAEAILRGSEFDECEVYTVFSVHNFMSGASSIKTLKNLYQKGCKLYHLPRLHAKIIVVPGKFATIGSQNVTSNGVKNKEASIITFDDIEIEKIEKELEKWFPQRRAISPGMITMIEAKITYLRRKFNLINRELRKEVNDLENELWEKEAERIRKEELDKLEDEIRRTKKERAKQEEDEKRKLLIDSARRKAEKLSDHGEVDRELAEEFIRRSACWDHPTAGTLVHAPKHAKRIYGNRTNWRIDFGANTFLVGHAITRCQRTILGYLEQAEAGHLLTQDELIQKLTLDVRGAVAGYQGSEYNSYYPVCGSVMMFGTQAIDVYKFISVVFEKLA